MKFFVFDYLRALGVILVTYSHVIEYGPHCKTFLGPIAEQFVVIPHQTIYDLVLFKFVNLGEIGVSTFFLVSGFLIMKSRMGKTAVTFLIRRLQRIYPIAIAGVLLSYIALMLMNHYICDTSLTSMFDTSNLVALFTNSLLINGLLPSSMENPVFGTSIIVPTYWFLDVILIFYILMCFIRKPEQEKIIILALILLVNSLAFVTLRSSPLLAANPLILGIFTNLAFSGHHILYILVGCSIYLSYLSITQQNVSNNEGSQPNFKFYSINLLLPVSIGFMFILSYLGLSEVPHFPLPTDMLKNYLISFVLFLLSLYLSSSIKRVPKIVQLLSNTSFSVYALHYSFAACFLAFLLKIDFFKSNLVLLYGLVFFLTGVCGYLLYRFVEEPMGKLKIK